LEVVIAEILEDKITTDFSNTDFEFDSQAGT
jgi:hypothetical protein